MTLYKDQNSPRAYLWNTNCEYSRSYNGRSYIGWDTAIVLCVWCYTAVRLFAKVRKSDIDSSAPRPAYMYVLTQ